MSIGDGLNRTRTSWTMTDERAGAWTEVIYRTMSPVALLTVRTAFLLDRDAGGPAAFLSHRIALLERILVERGVDFS